MNERISDKRKLAETGMWIGVRIFILAAGIGIAKLLTVAVRFV